MPSCIVLKNKTKKPLRLCEADIITLILPARKLSTEEWLAPRHTAPWLNQSLNSVLFDFNPRLLTIIILGFLMNLPNEPIHV